MSELLTKKNTLSEHVIQFSRFLRTQKYAIGPDQISVALMACAHIPFSKADQFKNALKSTLVSNKAQLDLFDSLYLQYWAEVHKAENQKVKDQDDKVDIPKPPAPPSLDQLKQWLYGNRSTEEIELASLSKNDGGPSKDMSALSLSDLSEIQRLSYLIAKKLTNSSSRRYIRGTIKERMDMKQTIKTLGKYGEITHLSYKHRKKQKLQLVLICDVSKSMELYSSFLVRLMYSLSKISTKIETFVFSTHLTRITKELKDHSIDAVIKNLNQTSDLWSGGTKIGSSLSTFMSEYGSSILNPRTHLMILSDGWDTEDSEITASAMEDLRRKVKKIIWLNPLASNPDFRPEVACLKAAMPYIDIFQSGNNVEDLRDLLSRL